MIFYFIFACCVWESHPIGETQPDPKASNFDFVCVCVCAHKLFLKFDGNDNVKLVLSNYLDSIGMIEASASKR